VRRSRPVNPRRVSLARRDLNGVDSSELDVEKEQQVGEARLC